MTTDKEERALQYAFDYLARQPISKTDNLQEWTANRKGEASSLADIFCDMRDDGQAGEADQWVNGMVQRARSNPTSRELVNMMLVRLIDQDVPLPQSLRDYLKGLLLNEVPPDATEPKSRPGPKLEHRIYRDDAIVHVIRLIERGFDIKPTRSGRRRESGCSIVAKAVGRLGQNIDEKGVIRIWDKRPNHLRGKLPPVVKTIRVGEVEVGLTEDDLVDLEL